MIWTLRLVKFLFLLFLNKLFSCKFKKEENHWEKRKLVKIGSRCPYCKTNYVILPDATYYCGYSKIVEEDEVIETPCCNTGK